MLRKILLLGYFLLSVSMVFTQTIQKTYINPVIPGDHPDPTLTKIGNDFYSSGSSFNPTPKIYHSTDLVHWEVIAQPVSASWSGYGDSPGGGIWGGHMVFYNGTYWHYFGKGGGSMYFVTAEKPEGPWSSPTRVNVPAGLNGLGVDNSIFIDDDNKWYMLTKAGRENNHILELSDDGQPKGNILDLTWLNPDSDGNPYGWAEGPVMWKHNGYYYYSFAQHLAGNQYVMRSDTLTDNKSDWTIIGTNIFTGSRSVFKTPNHISPAVTLDDGTSWVIAHSYNSNYVAHGRQGLLCEVIYDDNEFPKILRPSTDATTAPNLPNNGVPWAVPHSDSFDSENLNPEWSFLGYTSSTNYSLTEKPGWLKLSISGRTGKTTVIKNDGEHNFSLITKIDFDPQSLGQEAGLWIINGPQTHQVKVYSAMNTENKKVLNFSFEETKYEVENIIGTIVWLKLIREEHKMSGFYSQDGIRWMQIGEIINASDIDIEQSQFNSFTGNQQGLYVQNTSAFFDLYTYRDAYTQILAANPANQYGTTLFDSRYPPNSLTDIHNNDWALYASVEFGNNNYQKHADSLVITASCASSGGVVEVWLDSLNSNRKIAECQINSTGAWDTYNTFITHTEEKVTGCHDVYLKFKGADLEELFNLQTITFIDKDSIATSIGSEQHGEMLGNFRLEQNYPNPFNPATKILYSVPKNSYVSLKVYDILGGEVATIYEGMRNAGNYEVSFDGSMLTSSVYMYQLKSDNFIETKKFLLLK
ncbi:MAG: family 43 glycosylhydrolase [Bacteroidetes bacterium]|nr:family 43 glycosylhydrolase [Bacteroidota bacterium]MBU1115212.1 family 43 glycosylhydrolase [Bacteroidota bacterium]MBU1797230.1 family 43 glycosylhydrolase [Bacteroidota bacterium]